MNVELRTGLTGAWRVLAGFLIFYAFIVVLMVAISQQSVIARLSEAEPSTGYSSGYQTIREVEERRKQRPALARTEASLTARVAEAQRALRDREGDYHSAWGEFLPLLRRIEQSRSCGIAPSAVSLDQADARIAAWREVEQCAREGMLPPQLEEQFKMLGGGERSFPVAHRRALAAGADLEQAQERLDRQRQLVAAASSSSAEELRVISSFQEVDALRRSWFFGVGLLAGLPPAMVQLLLAAVSGAFGALLVTLVIIVYPQNSLSLTSSGDYGPRMLLGSLIALGVYVILLAGTAVLGTSSGFDAAGANYMTFCAISILAGMFSDRVAHWLSDRANTFFPRATDSGAAPAPGATT